MLSEKNKATRIMKEVISYFLENNLTNLDIQFSIENKIFILNIIADTNTEPDTFQKFLKDLQTQRQLEVDEYYNALLGSHSQKHDYTFLGKSIDTADGYFEDGKLHLRLTRQEEF